MGFYKLIPEKNLFVDKILKWIVDIVVVIMIALFFVVFMGEEQTIVGNSMSPVLKSGEKVLIDKLTYRISEPKRFDVIVFLPQNNEEKIYQTKRILGLPGETIQIKNSNILIDGEKIEYNEEAESIVNAGLASKKITLSYNEYFVIGDNWNSSEDSRYESIGNIYRDDIIGKAWLIVSPFARIGLVK